MFEDTLESQPEFSILSFLLAAPPRTFSGLELSRRLGLQIPALIGALEHMHRQGQVKIIATNGRRYFLLNQKYRLVPEIRAMLTNSRPVYQDELFTAIKALGTVSAAFLSGLFTGHPELPVDILIVGNVKPLAIETFIKNCERMMEHEINYSLMTVEEYKQRRGLFDRFIKDIFDYPHITVLNNLGK